MSGPTDSSAWLRFFTAFHLQTSDLIDHDYWSNDSQTNVSLRLAKPTIDTIYYAQLVYVPPIVIGCSLILLIFSQVRMLRTPDNYTIAFLAFADLLIGAFFIPITVGDCISHDFFRQNHFMCILRGPIRIYLYGFAMSMHMLLTVDRCLAIRWPFWYSAHMTNRKVVLGAGFHALWDLVIVSVYTYLMFSSDKKTHPLDCRLAVVPLWFVALMTFEQFLKILISIVCTAIVIRVACKSMKKERRLNKRLRASVETASIQFEAKVTFAFLFFFIILLPPTFATPLTTYGHYTHRERYYILGITMHLFNLHSVLNIVIYAMARSQYKLAFRFILTNRPCKWTRVSRVLREHTKLTMNYIPPYTPRSGDNIIMTGRFCNMENVDSWTDTPEKEGEKRESSRPSVQQMTPSLASDESDKHSEETYLSPVTKARSSVLVTKARSSVFHIFRKSSSNNSRGHSSAV